jgi:zinc transport system substrate-binding protein
VQLGAMGKICGALALAVTAWAGCGSKTSGSSGKPTVAVSIFPIYDLTRRIAGDRFEVLLVLPAGQSEHGYEPTPKEMAAFEGTKLGIAVGLEMDRWVENIMKSAGNPPMFHVGEAIETIPIDNDPISEAEAHEHDKDKHDETEKDHHDHDHKVGSPDPHVWMDPQRASKIVDAIAEKLVSIDAAGKDALQRNATEIKKSLAELDSRIAARRKAWSKRSIVTFHGSMAYYAKRYNITIAAVVEPTAGAEPTAAYIDEVVAAVKRGKAAALFTEPQLAKGPGEAIAREAKIPLGELDPVGGVEGRESYEALLTWNTDQLEKVLR